MKNKFLSLDNPCDKKWEEMQPNAIGRHCDLCSKNVIDFTQLSTLEISKIIQKSNGNICARLTESQLNTPLINLDKQFALNFPTNKVATSLLLATSLTIGQPLPIENQDTPIEFVENSDSQPDANEKIDAKLKEPKIEDTTLFKGKVIFKDTKKPVENAKIRFVTKQKILTCHTIKNGTFSMEIPTYLIDDDNVIRVSYEDVKYKSKDEISTLYGKEDYILSKKEMKSLYIIQAESEQIVAGGIRSSYKRVDPIVLNYGSEIQYSEFEKALAGKKSLICNLDNKEQLYFTPKFAVAIYGDKAKEGLYILMKK